MGRVVDLLGRPNTGHVGSDPGLQLLRAPDRSCEAIPVRERPAWPVPANGPNRIRKGLNYCNPPCTWYTICPPTTVNTEVSFLMASSGTLPGSKYSALSTTRS